MRKKNASTETAKPIEIPNPDNNPAVFEARQRHEVLTAKLSATTHERKKLESELGVKQGESDDSLEARMLAGSQEDARLLSNFMAGTQQQSTEDWLRRIYEVLEATRRAGEGQNGIHAISIAAVGGG